MRLTQNILLILLNDNQIRKHNMKKNIFYLFLMFTTITAKKVDILIYSFDRPLQLYALLESVEKYMTNVGDKNVLYRTSTEEYTEAYKEIVQTFTQFNFIKQGDDPYGDFGPLMMKAAFESSNDYVVFAVDDIIVKDYVDCAQCIEALEKTDAYALYLRLGKNITECYMHQNKETGRSEKTPVPPCEKVIDDIYMYRFSDGSGDWCYPHSNDMTIFKKKTIKKHFEKMLNTQKLFSTAYEAFWASMTNIRKKGLFFELSKMVNIPMNLVIDTNVKEVSGNRNMQLYTTEELLQFFQKGLKIDINEFHQVKNKSPHDEYNPTFIQR